jgi:hypothetical protein
MNGSQRLRDSICYITWAEEFVYVIVLIIIVQSHNASPCAVT